MSNAPVSSVPNGFEYLLGRQGTQPQAPQPMMQPPALRGSIHEDFMTKSLPPPIPPALQGGQQMPGQIPGMNPGQLPGMMGPKMFDFSKPTTPATNPNPNPNVQIPENRPMPENLF